MSVHRYLAAVSWSGSTGQGWDAYDRAHTAAAPPAEQPLTVTTGEGHGDPRHLNPEQLVTVAASSCQLLWFLHLAAKARIDVVAYRDDADAEMPDDAEPVRITRITLRPRITVASDTREEQVLRMCELAHERCYVANSLNSEVRLEPHVDYA